MNKSKVDNIVKLIHYRNIDELYAEIDRYLCSDEILDAKSCRLKNIQILSEGCALVYLEEDLDTISVRFVDSDGEIITLSDYPFDRIVMSCDEVKLMDDLGEVTIEGYTYDIDNIDYCINSYGGRFVAVFVDGYNH